MKYIHLLLILPTIALMASASPAPTDQQGTSTKKDLSQRNSPKPKIGCPIDLEVIVTISRDEPLVVFGNSQAHLLGFQHILKPMKVGARYKVSGILLEDGSEHYGALVIYARDIKEIEPQR